MSKGIYNKKLYPREDELPKFITMIGHDGEGNLHEVRYINEKELDDFLTSVIFGAEMLRVIGKRNGIDSEGEDGEV